jgi:hypothetical protein
MRQTIHIPTQRNPASDRLFHMKSYAWKCQNPQDHSCQVCKKRPRDFATTNNREPSYTGVCKPFGWSKAAPFYTNNLECFEPEAPE